MDRRTWKIPVLLAMLSVVAACSRAAPEIARATPTTHDHNAGTQSHSAIDQVDHGDTATPEAIAAQMAAAGYEERGQAGTWDYVGPPTTTNVLDATTLVTRARDAVARNGWETVEGAKADGFDRISKVVDPLHYFKRAFLDDGVTGDPTRPESLVYDPATGKLLAVMLMVPIGEHGPPVHGVADARWHAHSVAGCYGPDRMVPMANPARDGTCPPDLSFGLWSPEMLHIWFVGDTFSSKMPDVAAAGLADANQQSGQK